jgi:hypothetical protein
MTNPSVRTVKQPPSSGVCSEFRWPASTILRNPLVLFEATQKRQRFTAAGPYDWAMIWPSSHHVEWCHATSWAR